MSKLQRVISSALDPLRPNFKWIVIGFSIIISIGSILYTNLLVEKIKERESRQIEIYASSLEFLAKESERTNFILILDEIVKANQTIPVILTDVDKQPEYHKNLKKADKLQGNQRRNYLLAEMERMKEQHDPILVTLKDDKGNVYGTKFIFYKNSLLLSQLWFYPYVQLSIIALFGMITFLVLNYLKRAEQDRVWVGLAKETAHQLGTPLSSLMAWSEYLKERYPNQGEVMLELDKDIERLRVITDRFSSIGSEPYLSRLNIVEIVEEVVFYLQKRLSKKINIGITFHPHRHIEAKVNPSLFAWVIENLCKNAADAMDGKGVIDITILKANEGKVAIDVRDTGKGIAKHKIKDVFSPGYTTKKRGWGLGLPLARRIVEKYHQGKIFVRLSEANKGTTFRISINGAS